MGGKTVEKQRPHACTVVVVNREKLADKNGVRQFFGAILFNGITSQVQGLTKIIKRFQRISVGWGRDACLLILLTNAYIYPLPAVAESRSGSIQYLYY